ncbi:MAG: hypothetical protein Ta2B_30670 [Termitinemataceae bacterium]|nr:MAG: hypothetical protein Ta2B_30670 [Termitinemataceae bacterium]
MFRDKWERTYHVTTVTEDPTDHTVRRVTEELERALEKLVTEGVLVGGYVEKEKVDE